MMEDDDDETKEEEEACRLEAKGYVYCKSYCHGSLSSEFGNDLE